MTGSPFLRRGLAGNWKKNPPAFLFLRAQPLTTRTGVNFPFSSVPSWTSKNARTLFHSPLRMLTTRDANIGWCSLCDVGYVLQWERRDLRKTLHPECGALGGGMAGTAG